MDRVLEVLLGLLLLALVWTQIGWLAFLAIWRRVTALHVDSPGQVPDDELPTVTILIPVFNGAGSISAKLANTLELDYPHDRLRVVVASDGSTDGTNELVDASGDPRVRLIAFPSRRGKARATNDAMAACGEGWVLSTDVDTVLARDYLRRIAPHLLDPSIGMVDGTIACLNVGTSSIAEDVGLYWALESKLKKLESDMGLLAYTYGNCTAVRSNVFRPLEATEDMDFTTPLDAVAQRYRVVHEPTATVGDVTYSDLRGQLRARARMVTKNLPGTLRKLPPIWNRPGVLLALFSHKLLRWLTPVMMILTFAITLDLAPRHPLVRWLLLIQILFYALGAVGGVAWRFSRKVVIASPVFSFLVANVGFLIGVLNSLRGVKIAMFDPYVAATRESSS